MLLRFIDFAGNIYVVVGITYEPMFDPPECFVAVPLNEATSITKAIISSHGIKIPFRYAEEITDKKRLQTLLILFGD